MGTSSQKIISNVAGTLTEIASIKTSAGAGDIDKLVATTTNGIIDPTLLNAKNVSAGVGDAAKVPLLNASGVLDDTILNATVISAANKIVKLDGSGKLDITVLPIGIGADTASIIASEALAAGDLVNVWNNSSVANIRKADGSTAGKPAQGFVLSAVSALAAGTVYFEGTNTQCTGLTPGPQYLSAATAGKPATVAPSTAGQSVQAVGFAISATSLNFQYNQPITLA